MAKLSLEIPNPLSLADTKNRLASLLEHWHSKYGIVATWSGRKATLQGSAMGIALDGHVEICDGSVRCQASDPGLLLRGQAKKYLSRKLAAYLDPAGPPDPEGENA